MAKFTDDNGLEWNVIIDLATIYRYHQVTGRDAFAEARAGLPFTSLVDMAYLGVETQAKERGHESIDAWLRAIGKACAGRLPDAVREELDGFFPEPTEGDAGPDPQNPPNPGAGKTSSDSPGGRA